LRLERNGNRATRSCLGADKLGSFIEHFADWKLSAAHVRLGDPDETGL
jgi:hypothetical protein